MIFTDEELEEIATGKQPPVASVVELARALMDQRASARALAALVESMRERDGWRALFGTEFPEVVMAKIRALEADVKLMRLRAVEVENTAGRCAAWAARWKNIAKRYRSVIDDLLYK